MTKRFIVTYTWEELYRKEYYVTANSKKEARELYDYEGEGHPDIELVTKPEEEHIGAGVWDETEVLYEIDEKGEQV